MGRRKRRENLCFNDGRGSCRNSKMPSRELNGTGNICKKDKGKLNVLLERILGSRDGQLILTVARPGDMLFHYGSRVCGGFEYDQEPKESLMKKFFAAAAIAVSVAIGAGVSSFGSRMTLAEVPSCDHCHVMNANEWYQFVCTKCGAKLSKSKGKNPNSETECFKKNCGGLMKTVTCPPPG